MVPVMETNLVVSCRSAGHSIQFTKYQVAVRHTHVAGGAHCVLGVRTFPFKRHSAG